MKHFTLYERHYHRLVEGFENFLITRGYARSSCYNLPRHVAEFLHFLESRQVYALAQVEAPELEAFLDYLQNRHHQRLGGPLSAAYLNKYIQALVRFGEYVQHHQGLSLSVPLKAFKKTETPKIILSPQEVEALYQACTPDPLGQRDRAMLALYYGCGLRREEGERLNLADFQPERGLLYIRAGKTGQDRFVPLTSRVSQDLTHYRDRGRPCFTYQTQSEAFLIRPPGRRVSGQALSLRLKHLVLRSGIGKEISLHSLRHAIATHLWQAGMPLEQVARFLGHRSLESTQIYTHIEPGCGSENDGKTLNHKADEQP
ncbi:MAG: tyrosine-type recombinase/integrase [Bacteroidia bacterium]|nr:tyrosine-type recombinase/integrase [Bacteroidia bacterium]